MLSNEELAAVITVGHETRSVEFKAAGQLSDKAYVALVARAALAMANQRDGGNIVLGVDDSNPGDSTGLSQNQVREWTSLDDVADKLNRYCDPPLILRVEARTHPNGESVVVVEVGEFSEIPSLCVKEYPGILVLGQLYTRSLRKPESSIYHTHNEMREVLDLATQKGLRRFRETAAGAGIAWAGNPSDREKFQVQIDAATASSELNQITSEAHFRHLIYPQSFDARKVPRRDLSSSVRDSAVRLRGWPFPYVNEPRNGEDFIGEGSSSTRRAEGWRFYSSGLFADYRTVGEWPDDWDSFGGRAETSGNIPVWFALLNFTEALEFAARLKTKLAIAEPLMVRFEMANVANMKLVVADSRRSGFHQDYVYASNFWASQEILVTDEVVISGTRRLAAETALEFCELFGWHGVTLDLLEGIQSSSLS
ncbi:RNA-binding domain-containing protein [Paenarthrobacter aromaticivorans]|uniref:ATP-binding protein n=1 Tax=Paenarthrobacter aromaticivorans TaxID=2849150 RepID=A0ABS6ICI4_9MICC|nr:RNA-binding domain-containing protein [Paenarthrobacter sp. MMS21-TAE1-1]MBU8868583.1 ATP-binding protein [Paenarthrobacter sp. MMS21-TAE1-1]